MTLRPYAAQSFKQTHCSLSWGIFSYHFCSSSIEEQRWNRSSSTSNVFKKKDRENDFWRWCWQNMSYTIYQFTQTDIKRRWWQRNDTLPKSSALWINTILDGRVSLTLESSAPSSSWPPINNLPHLLVIWYVIRSINKTNICTRHRLLW